MVSFPGQPG